MQSANQASIHKNKKNNKSLEVELIEGSKIKVNRFRLEWITGKYKKNVGQMTRHLFKLIIGEEELAKMVPLKSVKGRLLIPEDIAETIFAYVNENVAPGHEIDLDEFHGIVRSLCCSIREKFKPPKPPKNNS
ncbi:hypothetical protein KQX54_009063 [Cotesia glomerata]|uniref:Uncharacterized protein n=1 Tax=Cotesia glomerata TaxID=32391 RepID=A0AAV7HY53_COTGL|nr:hypothetical protein KQX54_009063 [Cotesia glomerata]